MIIQIEKVLNSDQVIAINQLIDAGSFEDGSKTAGWNAQSVKQNRQWRGSYELEQQLNTALGSALCQHPDFVASAYPKLLQDFLISECDNGGHYGRHVDDALMATGQISAQQNPGKPIVRSDVACTIFLSAPSDYEGGELDVTMQGQSLQYKLPAGHALVYPSTSLHQVHPVTSGCRRVAVSWAQSHIRNAAQREILFDLDQARKAIIQQHGKTAEFDLISKSHSNLLRQWAET